MDPFKSPVVRRAEDEQHGNQDWNQQLDAEVEAEVAEDHPAQNTRHSEHHNRSQHLNRNPRRDSVGEECEQQGGDAHRDWKPVAEQTRIGGVNMIQDGTDCGEDEGREEEQESNTLGTTANVEAAKEV